MRRWKKEEIKPIARYYFDKFVTSAGLRNALKIHAELGRMLRVEKKRRQDMNIR